MSYDLCLLPQAKKPYYIENIRTNIYSLEELCFYLYNNACLIDETLMNERLLDWLRDELGLKKLYRQLYEQLEKKDGAGFFILPIFREAGYLTNTQMREYQEELAKLVGVRRETIGNLEKGRYNPSLVLAWNIAKVFGVPIEEVFTVEPDGPAEHS